MKKGNSWGGTLYSGGIDRGSQVLTPGRGLSNKPVGRGGTTTPIPIPFLQALFYTFIFSSTNGPKNGCLEKEMAGNPEWPGGSTDLL